MLTFAIIIMVASLIFAVAGWRRGRPRNWIFPSDALFVACVIFVGIAPLLNLRATTAYSVNYAYEDAVIIRTLLGIALMFAIFGLVWFLRPVIRVRSLLEGVEGGRVVAQWAYYATIALCILSAFMMLLDSEYARFRSDVFMFMTGQLHGLEYQYSRRFAYNDNILIAEILGRMRYSVFAFLFAMTSTYLIATMKNYFVAAGIAGVAFFLLSSSVSKLPFIYFLLYATLIFVLIKTNASLLRAKFLVPFVAVGSVSILLMISILYMVQYPTIYRGFEGWLGALELGVFRVFGAVYDGMLQYFTVYPAAYEFAYFTDSSVLAFIMDKPARDITMEVPVYFGGEGQYGITTTPTMFVGGAYASLGYLGVAFYSLIVALFAVWIDHVVVNLKQAFLRVAVYATMMLNIVFFAMVAAPTVLLTYGCIVIPVIALLLDGKLMLLTRERVRPPGRRMLQNPGPDPRGHP